MYAVIFKTIFNKGDERYKTTTTPLRELVKQQYNCHDVTALSDGNQELAISYWPSLDGI